ncbi:MAG: Hsp33 family molecular chaperone HslO [Pseudomonadota bacterium]
MTDKPDNNNILEFPMPGSDRLQTFQLEKSLIRGRIIRLGDVLNQILNPHDYPPAVAQVVAEGALLALLLSSMLKYDGVFTLQIQGDGPVAMMVADVRNHTEVRACATLRKDRIAGLHDDADLQSLFGKGYIAFTVDQGSHTERYQGIVELQGATLAESVTHYFTQSEQLRTYLRVAARRDDAGAWSAGGIMIQSLPLETNAIQDEIHLMYEEDWGRAQILLSSVTNDELVDDRLHENTVLYRLFHQEEVRVYPAQSVTKGCRCTIEKLENILAMMPADDRRDMAEDGKITMSCEFCSKDFTFNAETIK